MIRISKMTLAAAVGLAFSATAFAQGPDRSQGQAGQSQASGEFKAFQTTEHGQEAQRQMQALDTNRDQRLDRQEAQSDTELMSAWTDVDIDRDGSINAAEYYLFAASKALSEMEGQSGGQSAAVRPGAGEVGGGFGQQSQQSPGQGQQPSQGGLQSREGQQPGQGGAQSRGQDQQNQGGFQARAGQSQSFDEIDIDRDGQISQSELSRVGGASFATLDTNRDGQIDRQEYSRQTLAN